MGKAGGEECVNGGREGTMETKMEDIEAQTDVFGEDIFFLGRRRRKKKPKIGEFEEKGGGGERGLCVQVGGV